MWKCPICSPGSGCAHKAQLSLSLYPLYIFLYIQCFLRPLMSGPTMTVQPLPGKPRCTKSWNQNLLSWKWISQAKKWKSLELLKFHNTLNLMKNKYQRLNIFLQHTLKSFELSMSSVCEVTHLLNFWVAHLLIQNSAADINKHAIFQAPPKFQCLA